jgi:hypothetical protein
MRFHPERLRAWLVGLFVDFRFAWYASLLIVGLSLVVVLLEVPYPFLLDWFKASRATPWGIFTSIFIHENFSVHFLPNAVFLLILCLYFALTNEEQSRDAKTGRSRFFAIMTFAGAALANALFIIFAPLASSYGASGAVYASMGVVLGFALDNVVPKGNNLHDIMAFYKNKKNIGMVLTNLLIFSVFLWIIVTDPSLFLARGGNANVFAHGIAFIAAFIITTPVYTFFARRKMASPLA